SLVVGQTAQLSVTTKDSAGNVLTGRTITWVSSSTTVAIISVSGLVTAKAAGSATMTATREGKSGSSAITVAAAGRGCAAACRHVAVNGNDANAGTDTAPWRTIQHAADVMNPGETVIVN